MTPTMRDERQTNEWGKLEPIIRVLYFEEDMSLPTVMRLMEENYGLRAT